MATIRKTSKFSKLASLMTATFEDFIIVPHPNAVWYKCLGLDDILLSGHGVPSRGVACKLLSAEYHFSPFEPFVMISQFGTYALGSNTHTKGKIYIHDLDDELTLYFTVADRFGDMEVDGRRVLYAPSFGKDVVHQLFNSIDLMDRRQSLWGKSDK